MLPEANRTKQQKAEAAPCKSGREARRLAELDYLGAVRPETDHVLQEIVDEVRLTFEANLCMVNLVLSDVQYFRAWSGELPEELALARQDLRARGMCQYVVGTEEPLVVSDFLATEEFKDQYFCLNYGIHFYAGTPLVTSGGHAIGTLCLLDNRSREEFGEEQMRLLRAFARAVVGRLELLGALGREQIAREKEAQRVQEIVGIFESITDAFFALDKEWRFTYLNSEAEKLLNRGKEELLGNNIWEELPELVGSTFYLEYRRALAKGVTVEFEEYYPPLETWVAVRAYPSESGLSVYFRDINERKKAEEALTQSEERYRVLYEDNPSMYFTLDTEGTVLSVNRFGAKRLGYSPEELIGRSMLDIFHNEDRENILRNFSTCLKDPKQTESWEARKVRKDGSVLWVQEIIRVVQGPDGGAIVLVTCEDITERKQAERERNELLVRERQARAEAETTQQRLRTILDNLSEGVLLVNLLDGVVFANPTAHAMLGVTNGETLEELPDLWEDFNLPEAVSRCAQTRESIEARVSYGESYLRVKLECLANNERGEVLVVMQDLSEGHRLEANQQRFLANAAHQLRTPTMAVMGAAELLATGEDANPAIRRRLLGHIFSEGRRMQRLSDALLRLSRVGWDLREPKLEIVDLREAGQQAAELMEPLAESCGLRFILESEGSNVYADPEWLQEVLLVLFSNAIKHSSRGGDIRLRVRGGSFTVEDEGVGISPDDLPYVFERFYRGKASSAEGFGLGLPISRELIERMGGSIFARSREGIGTAVEIKLPEAAPNAQDNDSRG
ncbi:MAG TPA: PAS domain S-box protein [Rubrobacteraceae bacterium]|nr:PAS domain S-box protein [Rubrobacteraceae bacterium]